MACKFLQLTCLKFSKSVHFFITMCDETYIILNESKVINSDTNKDVYPFLIDKK